MQLKPLVDPLIVKMIEVPRKLEARDWILFFLIPINGLVFVTAIVFNFLAANPEDSFGLFVNGIGNVSRQFEVNISPAGFTFGIWSVIYLAQAVSVIYNLSTLCRRTGEGPAYANPPVLSRLFFLLYMTANAFNIGWLFAWDRLFTEISLFVLAGLVISIASAISIATMRLQQFLDALLDEQRLFDAGMIYVFVLNGGALYSTWTLIATHINLNISLVYDLDVDDETASLISLGILTFLSVVYTITDVFLFRRATRFLVSPYGVIIWASSGILVENYDPNRYSSILTLVLAIFSALALVFKVLVLFRQGFSNSHRHAKQIPDKQIRL